MPVTHPLLEAAVLSQIENVATRHLGWPWVRHGFTDLNDRASHPCIVLHGSPFSVFAKLSVDEDAHGQLTTELDGLTLLRQRAEVLTPTPIDGGLIQVDGGRVLLLEALTERPPESRTVHDWRAIGQSLAALHEVHDGQFGLGVDGYFGPLRQDNRPVPTNRWADFYAERRVLPLLRSAADSGYLPGELIAKVDRLVQRLPSLRGPEPRPALLHGDAQQHNFVSTARGAVMVDPSPYFGHPEVDLALVDYFEPVPVDVFHAYREAASIDPGFDARRELWRIFAYLAVDGANPFGRSFIERLAAALDAYE